MAGASGTAQRSHETIGRRPPKVLLEIRSELVIPEHEALVQVETAGPQDALHDREARIDLVTLPPRDLRSWPTDPPAELALREPSPQAGFAHQLPGGHRSKSSLYSITGTVMFPITCSR